MTTPSWYSEEAQQLREHVVSIGKRIWEKGMVAANDGNVSVRLPDGHILCTPTGTSKGMMTPESLAVVTVDGELVDAGTGRGPSSETKMHLRLYQRNPNVNAVVHTHSPYATAFAIRGRGLTANLMPETVVLLGEVPLATYATPSTEEVPDSIEPFIHSHKACLLEHHGALTWGPDLQDAYLQMERLEHTAHITTILEGLGGIRELNAERVAELKRVFG